jgi:hypothetical protein
MIFHVLTAVLVVLKLMELVTINWFLVFLPTVVVLLTGVGALVAMYFLSKMK